jgi:hypothetical protein
MELEQGAGAAFKNGSGFEFKCENFKAEVMC